MKVDGYWLNIRLIGSTVILTETFWSKGRKNEVRSLKKIFPKSVNVTASYSCIGVFTFFYFGLRSSDLPTGRQASDPLYYLSLNLPAVGRFRVEPVDLIIACKLIIIRIIILFCIFCYMITKQTYRGKVRAVFINKLEGMYWEVSDYTFLNF